MSIMLTLIGGALICLLLFLIMRNAMHRQHLYVRIARDKMIVRHIESGREVKSWPSLFSPATKS